MIKKWKCGYCGSVQTSDSKQRWTMDYCKCGKSAYDLEDGYAREMGKVEMIDIPSIKR